MIEVWNDFWTVREVQRRPDDIFVFGDNDIRRGRGGQAIIRDCDNTIGIRTKRLPSMTPGSFYSDTEEQLQNILDDFLAVAELNLDHKVWFPANGFGTGRARLGITAPRCAALVEYCTGILLNEEPAAALAILKEFKI